MRSSVRQSIKTGRVCAFHQYYEAKNCDDFLNCISEKLNVKGNIYDNIEAFLKYANKNFKILEKENDKFLTITEMRM